MENKIIYTTYFNRNSNSCKLKKKKKVGRNWKGVNLIKLIQCNIVCGNEKKMGIVLGVAVLDKTENTEKSISPLSVKAKIFAQTFYDFSLSKTDKCLEIP